MYARRKNYELKRKGNISTHTNIHTTRKHAYMHTCIHPHTHTTYTHAHIHVHTHTHTYSRMHSHTQKTTIISSSKNKASTIFVGIVLLVTFLQSLAVVANSFNFPWPAFFHDSLSWLGILLGDIVSLGGVNCFLKMSFFGVFLAQFCVLLGIVLLFLLAFLAAYYTERLGHSLTHE